MKFKLNNVRPAFPAFFKPKAVNGEGEPRFNGLFIMPPDHPQLDELRKAMKQVAKEKWGGKWETIYSQMEKKLLICLHDGTEKAEYEGFPGNFFLSAANKARPLVVDRDRTLLTQADGRPYAGCYVNIVVDIWAQDNNFGRRINASLKAVQFLRDGDAFTSSPPATVEDLDDISEGADADSLI
ncbi:DUF2815 domain-containing protein [Salmonella enterica subsp. diarizonae serovar 59:z10:-]|nr:DUF2815 domain-containing protein [Salmonella enterica subsp. diarizonae serovar 59:z10:-]